MRRVERDDLEADERPRRQDDQAEHRVGRVQPLGAEAHELGLRQSLRQAGAGHDEHARHQHDGKHRVNALQRGFRQNGEQTHHDERNHRHGCFAEVDVVAGYRVIAAQLQAVTEQRANDQEQRGAVQKHDRQVRQAQEPRAEECVVAAERRLRVGVHATCTGALPHEERETLRQNEHENHAEDKRDDGSRRPGNGQKRGSRHDERSPADRATKAQSPSVERGQVAAEPLRFSICQAHRRPFSLTRASIVSNRTCGSTGLLRCAFSPACMLF